MRQDAVFEVKLKALKTRFPEQPQESRNVDLLPLIRKMHLKTFTQIFSAFPHEERSSDLYRLVEAPLNAALRASRVLQVATACF